MIDKDHLLKKNTVNESISQLEQCKRKPDPDW